MNAERMLVSFGNYVLSKSRDKNISMDKKQVHNEDLENWKYWQGMGYDPTKFSTFDKFLIDLKWNPQVKTCTRLFNLRHSKAKKFCRIFKNSHRTWLIT